MYPTVWPPSGPQGNCGFVKIEWHNCAVGTEMLFDISPRLIKFPAIEVSQKLLKEDMTPFSVEDACFLLRVYAS